MKISIITPINDLGYGYTGLHIVDELMKLGHEVALFPIGKPYCHFRHEDNIKQAISNADKFSIDAPCIRIWHQHDMSMFVGKGAHIGFPIFELDTFTEKEKHHLGSCDQIFVCSEWAKDIIVRNIDSVANDDSVYYTKVVPLGVDTDVFTPKLSKRKPTIFFNCGKWEKRKGHYEVIMAFNSAFEPEDNVELWMMCENPFLNEEQVQIWHNRCKDSVMGHKIRILPRVETDTQVAYIMQQADCGVFPSRAEGWCFHPKTKILTNKGIKNIENVYINDKVINKDGEIGIVNNVFSRYFDDCLHVVKTIGSPPIKMTPEHEVFCVKNPYKSRRTFLKHFNKNKFSPKFEKINNLKIGDYLLIPRLKTNINTFFNNTTKISPTKDLMRLFGYYIAEGSRGKGFVTFSFHKQETKYHQDVISIIENNLGIYTNIEYLDRNRANIVYCCTWLANMFKNLFGGNAHNKHIPFEFMFLDNSFIKELLTGIFRGDGTCSNNRTFRLSTTSQTLAWQVKYLLIKIGIRATLNKSHTKLEYTVEFNGKDRHKLNFDNINIKDHNENKSTILNSDYILTPIKSITTEYYKGLVYDLEVSNGHTYCTSAFIVHNCIPALEMLSCGKQVIATNYSAHTEFLTEENARLVPIEVVEPAYDGIWFHKQGNWAQFDNLTLYRIENYMRAVHELKQSGQLELNTAGIETAKKFTWENTAKTIIQHLST